MGGVREETDIEYKKRVTANKRIKEKEKPNAIKREKQEYKEYLRLKKIFEK
jgi:hypothetical protein